MADFALLKTLKLISLKIWVIKEFWNFHTLWLQAQNMIITQCGNFIFKYHSDFTWNHFGKCRSSKIAISAILKGSEFYWFDKFKPSKNSWDSKFRVSAFIKMVDFETLDLLILISSFHPKYKWHENSIISTFREIKFRNIMMY